MSKIKETIFSLVASCGGLLLGCSYTSGLLFGVSVYVWVPLAVLGLIVMVVGLLPLVHERTNVVPTWKEINGIKRNFNIILCLCIVPLGPCITLWAMWPYILTFPFSALVALAVVLFAVQILCIAATLLARHIFLERAMRRRRQNRGSYNEERSA